MVKRCSLLLVALVAIGFAAATLPPVLPLNYISLEEDFVVLYQGDFNMQGSSYCCSDQSNCEIQTQYQSGHNYYDFTHNRTRFDDPVQGSIVSLFYPLYMEMAVDNNNNCQEYCPIEGDLTPYQIPSNAKDMGSTTVNGQVVENWQFNETVGGLFVMEIDDFFVDQTSWNNPIMVAEVDQLTPFGGPAIGTMTTNYESYAPGTPDPSMFNVKGVSNCPESANCGNSQRQVHRLRNHDYLTFMKYRQHNASPRHDPYAKLRK